MITIMFLNAVRMNKCDSPFYRCGSTTFSITTFSIMTLSIMAISIMTLSVKGLFVTLSKNKAQHSDNAILLNVVMLSVVMPNVIILNVVAPYTLLGPLEQRGSWPRSLI